MTALCSRSFGYKMRRLGVALIRKSSRALPKLRFGPPQKADTGCSLQNCDLLLTFASL